MKITRKTNILIRTDRRFTDRQPPTEELIYCKQCAEPMLSAQNSADFFGFSSRIIYCLIETGEIHFVETEANEIYVCPISVKRLFESS